ncbi:leucine-rich repeat domain superfamily [Holotrichia oblita]|uniref:Leucine-rich repeat domain superfamily n=1 Tax=Holotrichia oblita TaxID=644536 RepID=A0ACB9T067_HOLOL|nr:leucine-rich repeat domain superfamily [Holotrichia oblita]
MSPPKKKIKIEDGQGGESCHPTYDYSTLPYDVLLEIFKYLDFKTIAQCATLCRTFNKISNESVVYNRVTFKYNMDTNLLENYISKVRCPKHLSIEYKFYNNETENEEDYTEFERNIVRYINQSGSFLTSIHFESCRNDEVLSLLSECPNLTAINFMRCKGTFESLLTLRNLEKIELFFCIFPKQILQEILQNNSQLKAISLCDNSNLNGNDVCENLAKYNPLVEEVHIAEKRRVRTKGLKALARCQKLRILELEGGPFQCDPEDSLEQLAVGCPLLERCFYVLIKSYRLILHIDIII